MMKSINDVTTGLAVGAAMQLLSACHNSTAKQVPSTPNSTSSTKGSSLDCNVIEREPPSGRFAQQIASLEAHRNITALAVFREQKPRPSRFAPSARRAQGFPEVEFTYAKAYVYHYLESTSLDSHMSGCEVNALSADGQLCPSVLDEGVKLNAAQTRELLDVANLPRAGKQTGCGFEPRHAFVFYNAEDAPVAEIQVYLGCGRWDLSGSNTHETDMPAGALKRVEDLLRSMQLLDSGLDMNESDEEAFRDAYRSWKHSGALQRPSDMFKIPKDRQLDAMSELEKRQLCAWRIAEIASGHLANRQIVWTVDGVGAFSLRDFDECVFRFPTCKRKLGDLEGVDLRRGHDYAFVQPEACIVKWVFGQDGNCLWGIERQ